MAGERSPEQCPDRLAQDERVRPALIVAIDQKEEQPVTVLLPLIEEKICVHRLERETPPQLPLPGVIEAEHQEGEEAESDFRAGDLVMTEHGPGLILEAKQKSVVLVHRVTPEQAREMQVIRQECES